MRTASHLWQRAVADALASIGGIVVPIYPTSSAVECVYILGNSGARVIVWEDAAQHAKIAPARRELEARAAGRRRPRVSHSASGASGGAPSAGR